MDLLLMFLFTNLGKPPNKECHKKWKKFTIFLIPPSPRMFWIFLNLGKNLIFDDPPNLLDLIWEKFEIEEIFNFGDPPSKKETYA